ncbi:hypothetical protein [Paractinoplanes lichenicola]|uniref:Uncharacterized protein n=1 Tax=Paractinoplanes lichenicola TaxID=2802976 RepID=A0ABS1VP64_9ACTN|nr:hypothetical protein [Actinoplanes lichenicola]MBL7256020.1 hypothetical protein [Actinoplanes lichenicola]
MTSLLDRLDRLAGPERPVTDDQVAADRARGRRTLRRRRTLQGAATGVFAITAASAVIVYGTMSPPAAAPTAPVKAAPRTSDVARIELVAYRGQQPEGFTVDKVPAGWEIQGNDALDLVIAPIGARDQDPHSWAGKIAVMLEPVDTRSEPSGTAVRVGDRPGIIADGAENVKYLYVEQPNDVDMVIQIWDARGWTIDGIIELGAGIHALPTARQGHG